MILFFVLGLTLFRGSRYSLAEKLDENEVLSSALLCPALSFGSMIFDIVVSIIDWRYILNFLFLFLVSYWNLPLLNFLLGTYFS